MIYLNDDTKVEAEMDRVIAFSKLSNLATLSESACVSATLAPIPDFGCRLFVACDGDHFDVTDDAGEPFYFPTLDAGIQALAAVAGIDQRITVDVISLVRFSSRVVANARQVVARVSEPDIAANDAPKIEPLWLH